MLTRMSGFLRSRASRVQMKANETLQSTAIWRNGVVEIRESSIQGLGVYTSTDITKGTIVEVCPTLALSRKAVTAADSSSSRDEGVRLEDYVYEFPTELSHLNDDRMVYVPLGFGSLYNHSDDPNLQYNIERTLDGKNVVLVMKTITDVPAVSALGAQGALENGPTPRNLSKAQSMHTIELTECFTVVHDMEYYSNALRNYEGSGAVRKLWGTVVEGEIAETR